MDSTYTIIMLELVGISVALPGLAEAARCRLCHKGRWETVVRSIKNHCHISYFPHGLQTLLHYVGMHADALQKMQSFAESFIS